MTDQGWYPPVSPYATGLRGLCPRCGQGHIFDGFLKVAPRCEACGLDLSFTDTGDGPAFFVSAIVSFVGLGFALWVEFAFSPPVWVHLLVSLPFMVGLCLIMLRPLKGLLIALQYRNKAEEGRLEQ